VSRRPLVLLLLCLLALAAGCGGGEEAGSASRDAGASSTARDGDSTGPEAGGADSPNSDGCERVRAPEPKPNGGAERPSGRLEADATYEVTFQTSCGAFTVRLDQAAAPRTAASLVSLARSGFYDGTIFHRVVPGFVIQGGDPTGTGTGGPGYSTRDAPPPDAQYTRGVVAMAKTGAEPPGTAGSQFYVVTGADAGLPPDYAIVGKVVEGLDATARIDALGVGDGPPSQPVVIERASVSKG
jgi:cyclophilin family peptidyl-prolyl cis-trans isomerase